MVLLRLQFIFSMKCEVRSLVWESGKETAGGLRRQRYIKVVLVQNKTVILHKKYSGVAGSIECLKFMNINVE